MNAKSGRRHFLKIGMYEISFLAAAASPLLSCVPQSAWATTPPGSKMSMESWMEQLLRSNPQDPNLRLPDGPLIISRFRESIYFLLQPISWLPNASDKHRFSQVTVPKGFVTDFASIPKIFWSVLPPDGSYVYAAILHDYLYWVQTRTRADADEIFRLAMRDFDVSSVKIKAIYSAVRKFGGTAWRANQKLREKGERRVLVKFPNDPRIRWEEWKARSSVFGTE